MTVKEFTNSTIGPQLVQLEEISNLEVIFIGKVKKLRQNKELLEREIGFFTSFDFPNRIVIRLK